jgi:hypothetical protein
LFEFCTGRPKVKSLNNNPSNMECHLSVFWKDGILFTKASQLDSKCKGLIISLRFLVLH